ncbi:MAG: acetylxylan esterase [Paludibacteraceae bacterium]
MKKTFLFCLLLAASIFTAQAALERHDLDLSTFTGNYSTTNFTLSGNTLTFTTAWGAIKKDFQSKPIASYSEVVLVLEESCTQTVRLSATFTDGTAEQECRIAVGSTEARLRLNSPNVEYIRIANWSNEATDVVIKIKEIYLLENTGLAVSDTLFSGSQSHGGWEWNNRIVLAASAFQKAHTDAVLKVTYKLDATNYTYWQYKFVVNDGTNGVLTGNQDELSATYQTLSLASGTNSYWMYLNASDVAALQQSGMYLSGYGDTTKTIELIYWEDQFCEESIIGDGELTLSWSQLWSASASIINQLQAGDELKVYVVADNGSSQWPSVRIAWGSADGSYVGFPCYSENNTYPHEHSLVLTEEQVTAIQTAGKLYLSGAGLNISKFTWTHCKTMKKDRGNAATNIWSGTQSINWSGSNEWLYLTADNFSAAEAGMLLRIYFADMQMGAQGRIVDGGWTTFADADTYEKLPTAWGNYYEYTLTQSMIGSLQAKGLVVSGVGYTATRIDLIDPLRKYMLTAAFDTEDIRAWEADETPNMTFTLRNYESEQITTSVEVVLRTDTFTDFNTYTQPVTLEAGETKQVTVEMTDLDPGFYRLTTNADGDHLCTYMIGYNPTAILSPDDSQDDFEEFWTLERSALAAIPLNTTRTEYSTAAENYIVYTYSVNSVPDPDEEAEHKTLKHYVKVPNAEGKHPVLVRFQGTDGGTSTLGEPNWAAPDDWVEVIVSTRGQMLNRDSKYNYDFYGYGLGSNTDHYYRMAYLDCVRAIDMVKAMEEADSKNIFLAGGSQGGCFTYVTAGLCAGNIRAIAPSITGHADFVHTMKIVGWPTNVFNTWINNAVSAGTYADYETAKAALLAHQSYFDTKNFAKWITCPVITNFSLQDQTDGPHLNIAPYNLLTQVTDKEYSINPFNGHAAASDWNTTYMTFFQERLYKGSGDVPSEITLTDATACNTRKVIENGELLILHNGIKYDLLGNQR